MANMPGNEGWRAGSSWSIDETTTMASRPDGQTAWTSRLGGGDASSIHLIRWIKRNGEEGQWREGQLRGSSAATTPSPQVTTAGQEREEVLGRKGFGQKDARAPAGSRAMSLGRECHGLGRKKQE